MLEKLNIEDLPNELISHIISYTNTYKDVFSINLVSRRFRELARYSPLNIKKYFLITEQTKFIPNCKKYAVYYIDDKIVDERTFKNKKVNSYIVEGLEIFCLAKSIRQCNYMLPKIPKELSDVKHLKFRECRLLEDFSMLGKQKSLYLDCTMINNIDHLRGVPYLSLCGCLLIYDFSKLGKQIYLNLDCTNIENVDHLGKVKYLSLSNCSLVRNVSKLGEVERLNLTECGQVEDISNLGDVDMLLLAGCKLISNFSQLGKQTMLDINSTNIKDVSNLVDVKYLFLDMCENVTDFSKLGKQLLLTISGTNINDVINLKEVGILDISKCTKAINKVLLYNQKLLIDTFQQVRINGNTYTDDYAYDIFIEKLGIYDILINYDKYYNRLLNLEGDIIKTKAYIDAQ